MRIIFMGTPEFAAVCLKALAKSPHNVIAVVTQPDRPSGRGKKVDFSPVKEQAVALGISVFQPERIKKPDTVAFLAAFNADIFVVAAYGQILSQALLDLPKFGAINVHASLLPKYRGASPIQQAIAAGDDTTGITIMQMDKGMDTGDMLLKSTVSIDPQDTGGILHDKLCEAAAPALLRALDLIEAGQITHTPQDDAQATYAPLISKEMAQISWNRPSREIVNLIRAYNPIPGAYTKHNKALIKIWFAKVAEKHHGKPGEILLACPKNGIFVATADGAVNLLQLTPPGGKKMTSADYAKGRKINSGDCFEF